MVAPAFSPRLTIVRRVRTTAGLFLAAAVVYGSATVSCAADDSSGSTTTVAAATTGAPTSDDPAPPAASGDISVFAAASLTDAYTEIGDAFAEANPDARITFNFASSSDLVAQIGQGAPADVFASADEANMAKLVDAGGTAGDPRVFATNALQIIVEPGNPRGITGVRDLDQPGLLYVTCPPEVPIGGYAARVLANAGVSATPVSFEENVKGIVTKVTLGEADAGIVYRTDVAAAGADAGGVEIPADINVEARYPIAVASEAGNVAGAEAFVAFVLSAEGQRILGAYGFGGP
jgi:molybdate transport system substrate-binding protein